MTQEEIIEGNKLIAEFMGYKFYPNDTLNNIKGVLKMEGKLSMQLDLSKPYHPLYHRSWDWLMPVVEKINKACEKFGYVDACADLWNLRIVWTPIETVFQEVVKFIQWYNTQPKPQSNE